MSWEESAFWTLCGLLEDILPEEPGHGAGARLSKRGENPNVREKYGKVWTKYGHIWKSMEKWDCQMSFHTFYSIFILIIDHLPPEKDEYKPTNMFFHVLCMI